MKKRIWDRLIQQCIKQVMEPICEAKFSNNSYGFRPGRSVEHVNRDELAHNIQNRRENSPYNTEDTK